MPIIGEAVPATFQDVVIKGDPSGNKAEVNSDGQMHVVMEGKIDPDNTTTTPLLANDTFTGTGVNVLAYPGIGILVGSDKAGTLLIQYSPDGSDWHDGESYDVLAGAEKFFSPPRQSAWYRVVYTNGGDDQTTFFIHPILSKAPFKWSSHNIDMPIVDQDDAELVKAVITGKKANGTYDNVSLTNGANMKISLEEFDEAVSITLTGFTDNLDGEEALHVASAMFGRVDDDTLVPVKVDASTQDLQIVEHEHAEIHGGDHYLICTYVDLSINNVFDLQITTPDTAKWSHLTFSLDSESETLWEFYEGVTINTPGTAYTPRNNNRNSLNTSNVGFGQITNTSTANANADTAVAGALLIEDGIMGSGRQSQGANERSREIELKQNETYTLRFTANAAGYTNYCLSWYEHTDKN